MGKRFLFLFCLAILQMRSFSLSAEGLRTLYPPIEPYCTGQLAVEGGYSIYWEESGTPEGQPILFLHGGPGLGTSPQNRCFFDPEHYRIILFDQRGCGKSPPCASLESNTTWDILDDIERLRVHLGVKGWLLFGGSWGSTLALTYAIQYPERVQGLILRGIFLCRPQEIHWFYQYGAHHIFPDFWEKYTAPVSVGERGNMLQAFYNRLTSASLEMRAEATRAWAMWEGRTSKLQHDAEMVDNFSPKAAYALARIECHYFIHNAFFPTDNWILENVHTIRHKPCTIIQGRYDIPCPMISAWDLHLHWPEARFEIIPDAGHASTEPGIIDALIRATDSLRRGHEAKN